MIKIVSWVHGLNGHPVKRVKKLEAEMFTRKLVVRARPVLLRRKQKHVKIAALPIVQRLPKDFVRPLLLINALIKLTMVAPTQFLTISCSPQLVISMISVGLAVLSGMFTNQPVITGFITSKLIHVTVTGGILSINRGVFAWQGFNIV